MDYPHCGGLGYKKFLARAHKILTPQWYLEIGSSRGDSLALSKARSIAIDPIFRIKHNIWSDKPELHLYQMTSDAYFEAHGSPANHPKIDFAFLDGMHLFEYLLRDFIGTERVMAKDGVVMLHDCVPMSDAAADRTWDRQKTKAWTGDVWKLVPILRSYRPNLTIRVLDCPPSGLVVITDLDPANTVLAENYEKIVDTYLELQIADYGMARLHQDLALVHSESAEAAPFHLEPELEAV